jgi:hypothetical protein
MTPGVDLHHSRRQFMHNSGQARRWRIAGQRLSTMTAWDGEAAQDRVRTPQPPPWDRGGSDEELRLAGLLLGAARAGYRRARAADSRLLIAGRGHWTGGRVLLP